MMVNAETYIPILIPVNGSIFVGELITLFVILVFVLSVIWYGVKGFRQGGAEVRKRRAAMGIPSPGEQWRQGRAAERARRALPRAARPGFFAYWRKRRAELRAMYLAAAQPKATNTPPAANDAVDDSWRI
jgi:hypothetical protein